MTISQINAFGSYPYGIWSAHENRDLSRAAAEQYFILQSLAESKPTAPVRPQRSPLRRTLATALGRSKGKIAQHAP